MPTNSLGILAINLCLLGLSLILSRSDAKRGQICFLWVKLVKKQHYGANGQDDLLINSGDWELALATIAILCRSQRL
jgi:hypothetical protein